MDKSIVLILTDDNEPSAKLVTNCLSEIGQAFFRINVSSLVDTKSKITLGISDKLLTGNIQIEDGSEIDLEHVKSVWVRRPKPIVVHERQFSIEKQFIEDEFTASVWSLYTCLDSVYWMNHPLYARHLLEHNKLLQLKLAESAGLLVPDTLVTNNSDKLIEFCQKHGSSIAVKAVRSRIFQEDNGNATGIYTNRISIDYIKDHTEDIILAPIMAQEYVQKNLEFRVTVVGQDIFTCAIHSQDSERTKEDWRRYDFDNVKHESYDLPEEVKNSLLRFMQLCHLTFGAIDMVLTPEGEYVFLEVNPSGQYIWIENLAKLPISRSIAENLTRGLCT